jgi:hypothetical protein
MPLRSGFLPVNSRQRLEGKASLSGEGREGRNEGGRSNYELEGKRGRDDITEAKEGVIVKKQRKMHPKCHYKMQAIGFISLSNYIRSASGRSSSRIVMGGIPYIALTTLICRIAVKQFVKNTATL